jgi:hypothetical protein
MIRILKFLLIFFGIACITGCPQPDTISIILEKGEESRLNLVDSNYDITLSDIYPFMERSHKNIVLNVELHNKAKESVTLICSKSMIYSKTDTFTWHINDRYGIRGAVNDTITLARRGFDRFDMLFVGKKEYSRRLFRKTNKKDTLYFKLDFGKYMFAFPMRNHHHRPIWNRY